MVVDVIIPVYRPEREKLTKLIDWLNKQTVKPSHVFFMQTLVEEKEDEEVLQMLQKAENVEIVPIEKKDFDHGGTRNKGAALSKADYMLFMTQDAVPVDAYLIENLVQAMEEEEAATAYGRQLPDDTVGVIEHYTREFNYPARIWKQWVLKRISAQMSAQCTVKMYMKKWAALCFIPFSMKI